MSGRQHPQHSGHKRANAPAHRNKQQHVRQSPTNVNKTDGAANSAQAAQPLQPNSSGAPKKRIFEPYWSQADVAAGLKEKRLFQSNIRINPKNFEVAYVTHPLGDADVCIPTLKARNRALNDDIVGVLIEPKKSWKMLDPKAGLLDDGCNGSANTNSRGTTNATLGQLAATYPDRLKQIFGETVYSQLDLESPADPPAWQTVAATAVNENAAGKGAECATNPWWRYVQRTGQVVALLRPLHSRACVGTLRPFTANTGAGAGGWALFAPADHRLPRILIPRNDCPTDFWKRPEDFKTTRFIARIVDWPEDGVYARGSLKRSLTEANVISRETEHILVDAGIDYSEFSPAVLDCLPPQPDPGTSPSNTIPETEYSRRRDLRSECIFTIDPMTARDLDDALHIRELEEDDVYEVGVHIADVSYYVRPNTELDRVASDRATTVYLVQEAIPMLPRALCEHLCSLNPGEDKLAFSVVFKVTPAAEIIDTWIGRSVIRSCVKLSYEDAQALLDNPDRERKQPDLPPIQRPFDAGVIAEKVQLLNKLAVQMRARRFASGALRLDQLKLVFALNRETGLPVGYSTFEQQDSHRLVEEWMLAANMAVAQRLYKEMPGLAFLRRHPEPSAKSLDSVRLLTEAVGFPVDVTSSRTFQESIWRLDRVRSVAAAPSAPEMSDDRSPVVKEDDKATSTSQCDLGATQVVVSLCCRAMQLAVYFCSGTMSETNGFRHYALNVPLYTHFTSPIRRYADIVVHRQLSGILAGEVAHDAELSQWWRSVALPVNMTPEDLQGQAEICNKRRKDSKTAQENSVELFYVLFVQQCGPLTEPCTVMKVLDKSFDVLILNSGIIKRVYCEQLDLLEFVHAANNEQLQGCGKLTLTWRPLPASNCGHAPRCTEVRVLDLLHCILRAVQAPGDDAPKIKVFLQNPECQMCADRSQEQENQ